MDRSRNSSSNYIQLNHLSMTCTMIQSKETHNSHGLPSARPLLSIRTGRCRHSLAGFPQVRCNDIQSTHTLSSLQKEFEGVYASKLCVVFWSCVCKHLVGGSPKIYLSQTTFASYGVVKFVLFRVKKKTMTARHHTPRGGPSSCFFLS